MSAELWRKDRNRREEMSMAYGAPVETRSRYRDLDELIDYREYEGEWTLGFEELA
jgi:hypothetical protein